MAKRILPTKVKVLFDPNEYGTPVPLDLETMQGPTYGQNACIKECSHKGFKFCYFENTLVDGATLMAVPMILPWFFKEVGMDVRRLFLLRTGVTEKDSPKENRKKFFKDLLENGPLGCPIPILMKPNESIPGPDRRKYSPNFFTFNNMRFYPFLMREFTVGYFVCDENAYKYHWPKFHPKDKGIGLDLPVVYDPTLGLFVTRGAHYA